MRVRNGGWAASRVYESVTPLAASSAWAFVVLAGSVIPTMAPLVGAATKIGLVHSPGGGRY